MRSFLKNSNQTEHHPLFLLVKERKSFKSTFYSTHWYLLSYPNWKWDYCFNVYIGINSYLYEKQISCWKTWLLNIERRGISDICRSPCHICPTDSCRSLCIPSRRCHRGSLRAKGRFREGAACCTKASSLTGSVCTASGFEQTSWILTVR